MCSTFSQSLQNCKSLNEIISSPLRICVTVAFRILAIYEGLLGCYLNERFDAHRDVIAFLSNEQCALKQNHVTLGFGSQHPELVLLARRRTLYQTFKNRTEHFVYVLMLKANS